MKATSAKKARLVPEVRPTAALQMALETIYYKTCERLELINITKDLNEIVRKQGLKAGFVIVQSLHTTTAIFINEFQQALLDDIKSFLERIVGRITTPSFPNAAAATPIPISALCFWATRSPFLSVTANSRSATGNRSFSPSSMDRATAPSTCKSSASPKNRKVNLGLPFERGHAHRLGSSALSPC
jgi:hypothetical protein